jgi:hypothetical protein
MLFLYSKVVELDVISQIRRSIRIDFNITKFKHKQPTCKTRGRKSLDVSLRVCSLGNGNGLNIRKPTR